MVRIDLHWSKTNLSFFRCEQLLVVQYGERYKTAMNEWMNEWEKRKRMEVKEIKWSERKEESKGDEKKKRKKKRKGGKRKKEMKGKGMGVKEKDEN